MGKNASAAYSRVVAHPPTHLRVLGPPGSGKTTLLVERYRALRKRDGDHPPSVFILTYSRSDLERLTQAVVERNSGHVGDAPVWTFFHAARSILAASGRSTQVMSELEERLLLEELIRKHTGRFRSDYSRIAGSPRFAESVAEVIHVLLQNEVMGDLLERVKAGCESNARLFDMLALYDAFLSELRSRGRVTFYDISFSAAERLGKAPHHHPLKNARVLLIEDFQDIDPGQYALIKALAPPDGKIALNVFGDPMGAYFGFRGTNPAFLLDVFPRDYRCETVHLPAACRNVEILGGTLSALLRENIEEAACSRYLPVVERRSGNASRISNRPGKTAGEDDARLDLSLEVTKDEADEVAGVADRVHRWVVEKGYRPDEIAIVAREKARYEPLLVAAFHERGIPIASGGPRGGALLNFVYNLLRLIDDPTDPLAERAILTSPLYAGFPTEDPVVGAQDDPIDDPEKRLRLFVGKLSEECREVDSRKLMERVVRDSVLPMIGKLPAGRESAESYGIVSRMLADWDQYVCASEMYPRTADISTFLEVSRSFSGRPAVPAPSQAEVGFYSCWEAHGLAFPVVFVLGCSEMIFPAAERDDPLVPFDTLQRQLNVAQPRYPVKVYGAQGPDAHIGEEYRLLYLALTRAQEVLHFTAPRAMRGEQYPAPSTILKSTLPESIFASPPPGGRIPPHIHFAHRWVQGRGEGEYRVRLARLSAMGALWNAPVPAVKLFAVHPFPLSQGSLSSYVKCHRLFFYKKVLRIPEIEGPALKLGTFVHQVMAEIGRRYPTRAALHGELSRDFVCRSIDRLLADDPDLEEGSLLTDAYRHHVEDIVNALIALDAEAAEEPREIEVEQNLCFSHGGWVFQGTADRIDHGVDGGRTLFDYKTGTLDRTGKTIRRNVLRARGAEEAADWQVPLYCWGVYDSAKCFPRAFTYCVVSSRGEAFFITLSIHRAEEEAAGFPWPGAVPKKRHSYLLESELRECMDGAAAVAGEIFSPTCHFERTSDTRPCRTCMFERLCQRNES